MDLREILAESAGSEQAGHPSRPEAEPETLRCSAKACHDDATWAIRWNNPKLHAPERRKVWLACDTHEPTLRDFLSMRGFYRDTVRPGELTDADG